MDGQAGSLYSTDTRGLGCMLLSVELTMKHRYRYSYAMLLSVKLLGWNNLLCWWDRLVCGPLSFCFGAYCLPIDGYGYTRHNTTHTQTIEIQCMADFLRSKITHSLFGEEEVLLDISDYLQYSPRRK